MAKSEKALSAYKDLLNEYKEIESVIASLPRGYISEKVISGHVYHYLQWREGTHVLSTYVAETHINSIRQKILIRKQNEELLKILKKDLRKLEKELIKSGFTQEELDALKA